MISVIIPAYNSGKTIAQCLRSLKNQSYMKPCEIIVVDDGSTDNTAKEAKKFRGVRVISQKNSGPAKARNTGTKAAKGSIVLFTDADCVAEKDWLKEMLKPFGSQEIAGVQGRYETKQTGIIPVFVQAEIEQRYERMKKSSSIDFVGSYAAAYRRDIFLKFRGFDESFPKASGEDPELSFRIAKAGYKMVFNPKAVVYHTHTDSLRKYLWSRYYRGYWGRLLYKKHPDKKSEGSGKSGSFFYGVVLTCLFTLLLPVSLPFSVFASLLLFILLIGTVLFESAYFMVREWRLALAAPFMVFLRNICIGLGIVMGMIKIR